MGKKLFSIAMAACMMAASVSCTKSADDEEMIETDKPVANEADNAVVVDLGLSVKWADFNVGAGSVKKTGNYYSWGEVETKKDYSWSTYKFGHDWSSLTKYASDGKMTLDPEDDVAHVKWGGEWRMPTLEEFKELKDKCKWTWTTENGIAGEKIVGPNGKSIFLPAAGSMPNTGVSGNGTSGCYWTSSIDTENPGGACLVKFSKSKVEYVIDRNDGFSVRPVCK